MSHPSLIPWRHERQRLQSSGAEAGRHCTPAGSELAQALADSALALREGHEDEYVLAQFGHAVLERMDSSSDRQQLVGMVFEELGHSPSPSAAALVTAAIQAGSKPLEALPLEDLQDLALYEVLRQRHRAPEIALADYGMRATMTARSWRDKATVSTVLLTTVIASSHDEDVRAIAHEAQKRCFDAGVARGREPDASILMEAFPRILRVAARHEQDRAAAAQARREHEVKQLAEASVSPPETVHVEESFVDLGGLRVPRRPRS